MQPVPNASTPAPDEPRDKNEIPADSFGSTPAVPTSLSLSDGAGLCAHPHAGDERNSKPEAVNVSARVTDLKL